jgi:hypothetical protein
MLRSHKPWRNVLEAQSIQEPSNLEAFTILNV